MEESSVPGVYVDITLVHRYAAQSELRSYIGHTIAAGFLIDVSSADCDGEPLMLSIIASRRAIRSRSS